MSKQTRAALACFSAGGAAALPVIALAAFVPISGDKANGPVAGLFSAVDVGDLLNKIYLAGVGAVAVLAVIMIIWGAIQIVGESVIKVGSGKEKIWNAVWGLLLALGSMTILTTISTSFQKAEFLEGGGGGLGGTATAGVGEGAGGQSNLPSSASGGAGASSGSGTSGSSGGGAGAPASGAVPGLVSGNGYNPTLASEAQRLGWSNTSGYETLMRPVSSGGSLYASGKIGSFAGTDDNMSEGLANAHNGYSTFADLNRDYNSSNYYLAYRYDASQLGSVSNGRFEIVNPANNRSIQIRGDRVFDWGPDVATGRSWDTSQGALTALGAQTDDTVYVRWVPN